MHHQIWLCGLGCHNASRKQLQKSLPTLPHICQVALTEALQEANAFSCLELVYLDMHLLSNIHVTFFHIAVQVLQSLTCCITCKRVPTPSSMLSSITTMHAE